MIKFIPDSQPMPITSDTSSAQSSLELLNSFLNAPVTKLDADEYMANDLDGVTESLLGSGNLNFLMMQAGQTNESMANTNPFNIESSDFVFGPNGIPTSTSIPLPATGDIGTDTATDRPVDTLSGTENAPSSAIVGNGSAITVGTLGASNLAANSQSTTPFTDTNAFSSTGFSNQTSLPSQNGQNGQNGTNGEGSGNTTIINNNNTTFIDNTFTEGDTTVNIVDENILISIENITNNTVVEMTDFLTTVTNNVTNIVNNVLDGGGDSGPIGISLGATLDNLTNVTLDFLNAGNVVNVINETVDLSPVLDPLSDLTGNLFANASLDALLDPFRYDPSPNDSDLQIETGVELLGLDIPDLNLDIPLDPVEVLVGDIDINLDITQDLLGLGNIFNGGNNDTDLGLNGLDGPGLMPVTNIVDTIANPLEDITGDIDVLGSVGLGLLGTDNDVSGVPDTDITLPLDLNLAGGDLLNDALSVSLDPVESILGDIDIDLTVAGNILGTVADPLIDGENGGTGMETPLSMVGDGLSDIAGHLLPLSGNGDTDLSLNTGIDLLDTGLLGNGAELVFDPVENLTGDIDIGGTLGLDLVGSNDAEETDTDIAVPVDLALVDNTLLGDTLEISLDPLENITGDIDLDMGIAANIFGDTAAVFFDTEPGGNGNNDLLTHLGDTGAHLSETLLPYDGTEETDLDIDTLIDQKGVTVGNNADLFFDPVETITGDLDIDMVDIIHEDILAGGDILGGLFDTAHGTLESAIDLVTTVPENTGGLDLGALAGGIVDTGGAIPSWTETLLPDAGNVLGGGISSVIDTIMPDAGPILPTIPLSAPALPFGGFGGGGHHGHGGLFG